MISENTIAITNGYESDVDVVQRTITTTFNNTLIPITRSNALSRIRRAAQSTHTHSCTTSSDRCSCTSDNLLDIQYEVHYESLTLPAYFPIHGKHDRDGDRKLNSKPNPWCTQINAVEGILPYLAFRYAIERVNDDDNVLPNVKLGYIVFDTCFDGQYAESAFRAFHEKQQIFAQPPQPPLKTYIHSFIGGMEEDVTAALDIRNSKSPKLLQVN